MEPLSKLELIESLVKLLERAGVFTLHEVSNIITMVTRGHTLYRMMRVVLTFRVKCLN